MKHNASHMRAVVPRSFDCKVGLSSNSNHAVQNLYYEYAINTVKVYENARDLTTEMRQNQGILAEAVKGVFTA